jgi:hypothetical protein
MNKTLTYVIIISIICLACIYVASPSIINNQITFKRPLTGLLFFVTIVTAILEDGNLIK